MIKYIQEEQIKVKIEERIEKLENRVKTYKENNDDAISILAVQLCIGECKIILSFVNSLPKYQPQWSEEDERLCQCLIRDQEKALDEVRNDKYGHSEIISDLKEMYRERINWLESLKQRLSK